MTRRSVTCDRARLWASLEVDSELSELERASLLAHVAVCPACRAYRSSVHELATTLRRQPLVEPAPIVLAVAPPRRHTTRLRLLQVAAAAAAIAVAVGLGTLAGSLSSPHGGTHPSPAAVQETREPYLEQSLLAMLDRLAKVPHGRMVAV